MNRHNPKYRRSLGLLVLTWHQSSSTPSHIFQECGYRLKRVYCMRLERLRCSSYNPTIDHQFYQSGNGHQGKQLRRLQNQPQDGN